MIVSLIREASLDRSREGSDPDAERLLREVVRLNTITVGIAFGVLGGWALFLATLWLVLKGGSSVGPHLWLLVNYFPGYSVSFLGSLIGFVYGFLTGFVSGSVVAWLYNYIVWLRGR
jgi:hypothetical protein